MPITIDGYEVDCDDDVVDAVLAHSIDLESECWDEHADEEASNGTFRVLRWGLQERSLYIDLDQGVPDSAAVEECTMEQHITQWPWGEMGYASLSEWMAAWECDGLSYEEPAPDDYDGPCYVWHAPNYYQGTFDAPLAGYARDSNGEVIEFETRAKAQAYVDEYYSAPSQYEGIPACNVLTHGQAGPDELTIVKAR